MTQSVFDALKAALADRYRLEREIGTGGMSIVFLAYDIKHERDVAVKVLKPALTSSLGTQRFLNEIAVMARLQHPNVLPVYDSGEADGLLYYVMPYVEGESLRERLTRDGRIPIEEAVEIAHEVAEALSYAHSKDVIHRDIKPENIMLSSNQPMIADFGVARAVRLARTGTTDPGMVVGTPAYMSPEQIGGTYDIDHRTDIYSLGCILYEMLAGNAPFTSDDPDQVMYQHLHVEPHDVTELRPEVPARIARVLSKALAKRRERRFPDAMAFADALGTVVGDVASQSRHAQRRVAMVLALVVAIIVVGGTWLRRAGTVPNHNVIAILPFSTTGPNVDVLAEGIADLLATNIDQVGELRTIRPRIILRALNRQLRSEDPGVRAAAVGREVGAGLIVSGEVIAVPPQVRIIARLTDSSGDELARAHVEGPSDSVLVLVDQISLELLREVWRSSEPIPTFRLSAITTSSLSAIRAYLRGEGHYRRSEWPAAIEAFERALTYDSLFALAHLRLGQTLAWSLGHDAQSALLHYASAQRHAHRLPERERAYVRAHLHFAKGELAAYDTITSYVERFPSDPDGWYLLGDVLFHAQHLLGLTIEDQYAPFDSMIALDSTVAPSFIHPLELSLATGEAERFHRYLALLNSVADDTFVERFRLAGDVLWGGPNDAQSALRTLAQKWPSMVSLVTTGRSRNAPLNVQQFTAVLDSVAADTQAPMLARRSAAVSRAWTLLLSGRLADLKPIADSLTLDSLASNRLHGLLLLHGAVLAGYAPRSYAATAERLPLDDPEHGARSTLLRAQVAMSQGRTAEAEELIARGRSLDTDRTLAPLFDASVGYLGIVRGDSVSGLEQLRLGLERAGFANTATPLSGLLRYQLATVLAQSPATARNAIQRLRFGFYGDPAFLGRALLDAGTYTEEAGNNDAAAQIYSKFLALRQDADPEFQDRLREIRRRLMRLETS